PHYSHSGHGLFGYGGGHRGREYRGDLQIRRQAMGSAAVGGHTQAGPGILYRAARTRPASERKNVGAAQHDDRGSHRQPRVAGSRPGSSYSKLARGRENVPRFGAGETAGGKPGPRRLAQPGFLEGILPERPGPDRKDQYSAEGSLGRFRTSHLRLQRSGPIAR